MTTRKIYYCVERIHVITESKYQTSKFCDVRGAFKTRREAEALRDFLTHFVPEGIKGCACEKYKTCDYEVKDISQYKIPMYCYVGTYYHDGIINNMHPITSYSEEEAKNLNFELSNDGYYWINTIPSIPEKILDRFIDEESEDSWIEIDYKIIEKIN